MNKTFQEFLAEAANGQQDFNYFEVEAAFDQHGKEEVINEEAAGTIDEFLFGKES